MSTLHAATILKNNQLRLTNCRKEVIMMFLAQKGAISQPDLEKTLQHFDRVTLYRTLQTFLKKGIVHKVLNDSGVTKYAMCSHTCTKHEHFDEHIHFKCLRCTNLVCLNEVILPKVNLPKGYSFINAHYLIQGICPACQ